MSNVDINLIRARDGAAPQHKVSNANKFELTEGSDGAQHVKIVDSDGNVQDKISVELPDKQIVTVDNQIQLPTDYPDKAVEARLQAIESKQQAILDKLESGLDTRLTGSKVEYRTPLGFNWVDHPLQGRIFKDTQTGEILTDFDVSEYDNVEGRTYYVDNVNGHSSNDGLSPNRALPRLRDAVRKDDVGTVIIMEGYYNRQEIEAAEINKSISIKGMEGHEVILSVSDDISFNEVVENPNVFLGSRSGTFKVIDRAYKDEYGDVLQYERVDSVEEVSNNRGTWFLDGSDLYVRTIDDREPDSQIRPLVSSSNINFKTDDGFIYLENLTLEGGNPPLSASNITDKGRCFLYAKNVNVKYSRLNFGAEIKGVSLSIFQNCTSSHNPMDGFNYHTANNTRVKAIEINCKGYSNGIGSDIDVENGSSMHGGGNIIRLFGEYFHNQGPNVIDVNDGTQSWNIGVSAYASKAQDSVSEIDFSITGGRSEMWLDSCIGYGSDKSLNVGNSDSKAYIRDSHLAYQIGQGKKYTY